MAAAVEQHHVAGLGFGQAGQQTLKVQRMVSGVVVGIFAHFQPGRGKHALVVRPAWVAHPHAFHVGVFGEEVSRDTQSASTAWGLRSTGAFISDNRIAFTEQQLLGAATKFRNTIDAQIVFSRFIFQQVLLCFLDAGQNGCFTGFILVNTNSEVNLFRAVIGTKQIGQT